MNRDCPLCGEACVGAELEPLLDQPLRWLWEQIGRAADRRGDAALVDGSLAVRAPQSPDERAATAGLLGGRVLKPGQTRNIDLSNLTQKLRVRGAHLTPGAVAAHALGRRLATRAVADAQRQEEERKLLKVFVGTAASAPSEALREPDRIWAALRRSGGIARLLAGKERERSLRSAVQVIAALPPEGGRIDRRRLAADATGNPHALDHGSALAGLVMAILVAAARLKPGQRPRAAWASVGVDCDDVVGGLAAVGLLPVGWSLPPGALVTLPPRVLNACEWPQPSADRWVFVTENPSVASAAADLAATQAGVRLLCTSGTPSAGEIAAIARLALVGWRIAVRADFDAAGLGHVAAVMAMVPEAVPWRMGCSDYLESLSHEMTDDAALERIPDAPWDRQLAAAMREKGVAAYEESLLPLLLEDLRRGTPGVAGT
jgi:uncharacterized protein (TIGR02679 family)